MTDAPEYLFLVATGYLLSLQSIGNAAKLTWQAKVAPQALKQ
jgi:hypothetical protein